MIKTIIMIRFSQEIISKRIILKILKNYIHINRIFYEICCLVLNLKSFLMSKERFKSGYLKVKKDFKLIT